MKIKNIKPGDTLKIIAEKENNDPVEFDVITRLDTHIEVEYFKNGVVLPYILRKNLTA